MHKSTPVLPVPVIVALGANLPSRVGPPEKTIYAAIKALDDSLLELVKVSSFYATPCFPAGAGPDYVNAVVVVSGSSIPADVLAILHQIEADFGRQRLERWGQRVLDLDLIALGDQVLPDDATQQAWRNKPLNQQMTQTPKELILPHPRLQERAFVLVPMAEIIPDWCHPMTHQTTQEMLEELSDTDKTVVTRLELDEV